MQSAAAQASAHAGASASEGAGSATDDLEAAWHDPKRYAWLLGLVVPTLPFLTWALVHITGLAVLWFYGPVLIFAIFPLLDLAIGMDASNPPDSVIKWLEQDRYYRWCTYLYLPIQYGGLIFACWLWSHGNLTDPRQHRPGTDGGDGQRHRHQHRPRARPQARQRGALAEPGGAGAERLRALLHRAQPRPPRAAWPPPRTPPARAWARASTRFCRAP